jgi:hypothetical protein
MPSIAITAEVSEVNKWVLIGYALVIFIIVSLPITYKLTNLVFSLVGVNTYKDGGATIIGVVIHAIVFILLFRASMFIPLKI